MEKGVRRTLASFAASAITRESGPLIQTGSTDIDLEEQNLYDEHTECTSSAIASLAHTHAFREPTRHDYRASATLDGDSPPQVELPVMGVYILVRQRGSCACYHDCQWQCLSPPACKVSVLSLPTSSQKIEMTKRRGEIDRTERSLRSSLVSHSIGWRSTEDQVARTAFI